jgi:hypothetical protein
LLNSYVANFLVRLRVTTHVGARIVAWLPAPRPSPGTSVVEEIADLARGVAGAAPTGRAASGRGLVWKQPNPGWDAIERSSDYLDLQARVARLYECSAAELERILETFPLVPLDARRAVASRFARLNR